MHTEMRETETPAGGCGYLHHGNNGAKGDRAARKTGVSARIAPHYSLGTDYLSQFIEPRTSGVGPRKLARD